MSVKYKRFLHPVNDKCNRFQKWITVLRNSGLLCLDQMKVYATKRVCGRHLSPDCYVQLKRSSISDILLPGQALDISMPDMPSHSTQNSTGMVDLGDESFLSSITSHSETVISQEGTPATSEARRSFFLGGDAKCSGRRRGILQKIGVSCRH